MSDRFDGSAEIEVTADGASFVRELAALITAAERRRVNIQVDAADTGNITASINAAVRAANTETDVDVEADPDQVRRAIEAAAARANPEVPVEVTPEFRRDSLGRLRDALGRFVDEGGRTGRQTGAAFSEGLQEALSSLTGVRLPVVGFAVLGAAAAAAAAQLVQFAAAVAPAVGIAATIPAVLSGAAGAIATFRVALVGVGDAFAAAVSGDGEEFTEALEGLAPSAQSAAQALREITPEFAALREQVQGAFFTGFDQLFRDIASTLAGPLTEGLTASAGAINGIALAIGEVITSTTGVEFVQSTFDGIVNAAANLEQPIADLVDGFMRVGTAINEAFGGEDALSGISGAIEDFAAFLGEAAASGEAVQWVEDALAVFDQLGAILAPLTGIFGSIGEAASQTGGSVLGLWGSALEAFDEFLASADGMDFLVSLFETFNAVGSLLGDVLAALAPAFIPIVNAILLAVQAVSPFIVAIAQVAGLIIQAVMPAVIGLLSVITPLAQLFGDMLVIAITAAADALVPLIDVAYQMIDAFAPLFESLATQLLPAFVEFTAAVAGPLSEAIAQIIPVLVEELLPAIAELAIAFIPLVVMIADLAAEFLEVLAPVIADIITNYLLPFALNVIPALVAGIQLAIAYVEDMIGVFRFMITAISDSINWWQDLAGEVSDAAGDIIGWVNDLTGGATNLRDAMLGMIDDIIAAWLDLRDTVSNVWSDISGFVSNITGALNGIDLPDFTGFSFSATGTGGAPESESSSSTVNNNVTVNAAAADPWLVGGAVARTLTRAALGGAAWGTSS